MELKFGILKCDSGSSQDIINALERLLNEFDAWGNFKMIICDTVKIPNTGNHLLRKLLYTVKLSKYKSHQLNLL